MKILTTDIIGYTAAVCGTLIMLPQVIKSLKTKRVKDLSTIMLLIFLLNSILWTTYGFLIASYPVMVSNALVFMLVSIQIMLKIKYS